MSIETDLEILARQERELWFPAFTEKEAWQLGLALRATAEAQGMPVAIDISRLDRQLFYVAMPGAVADNAEWVRRKRNAVIRFGQSSYRIGRTLAAAGKTLAERYAVDPADYAAHGGAFPLHVRGAGLIGTVTVSGLPQREDHNMVVAAVCAMLDMHAGALRLPD
jgi:uncharacterized protein (UPF0303 family)